MMKNILLMCMLIILSTGVQGQSLEDLLDETIQCEVENKKFTATSKSVQLINSHTTKPVAPEELIFLISHRFGYLNSGFSDLFGLDQATVRFGFEYGLNEKLSLGFGRSTYKRNYDFFGKYALLQQSTGRGSIPLNITLVASANISSARWPDDQRNYLFAHRMSYSAQFLLSRKFSNAFSLQLMPTYIHRNLVEKRSDQNDVLAIGAGGRMKVSKRAAFTFEYYQLLPGETARQMVNPLSLGFDIETGGHVFQLFMTNASAIYEAGFVAETTDQWRDGNIRFGFNISRTF
jgi:hypothetical protein